MTALRRAGLLALVTAFAATSLTACAPSTLPVFIPNGTSICSDSDQTRTGSFGVPLTNTTSTPITLTDAGPMAVSNVDVLGSWIVPAVEPADDEAVFADDEAPGPDFVDWEGRLAPDGAVIPAGGVAYLVIVISLPDGQDSGWIEGVQATAGDSVKLAPDTSFGLSPGGDQCPWSPPGGMPEPSPTETDSP